MNARLPLTAVSLWLCAALCAADAAGGWTVVNQERGITVSRRVQPGCCLPSFRGQGQLRGNVLQLLAVVLDLHAVGRWAHGVHESRPIKRIDARRDLVYLTSDLPWPIRDRDMVVRTEVEVLRPGKEFRVSLRCEPEAQPERSDMIRVKRCQSNLILRMVDAETTEVDYVMTLDPGGHLPRWSAEWIAKSTPLKTLVALETRARESAGQYAAVVRSWSAAF